MDQWCKKGAYKLERGSKKMRRSRYRYYNCRITNATTSWKHDRERKDGTEWNGKGSFLMETQRKHNKVEEEYYAKEKFI